MRVLIVGAGGMLGHKVWQIFRDRFDCRAAVRTRLPLPLFDDERVLEGLDAADSDGVQRLIATVEPDVVVNCIGVVKQLAAAHDPIESITLNALLPHVVARACAEVGARLIHISTDCVFAGTRGHYTEADLPDAVDLYGRSKLLGEVIGAVARYRGHEVSRQADAVVQARDRATTQPRDRATTPPLTIRTSIIGRELRTSNGLVEWFLANRGGSVRGFTRAVFSGVTTAVLAETLAAVIEHHPDLHGLYHVAGTAIPKYDLLMMLNEAIGGGVTVTPDESVVVDRSLVATRFQAATGLVPPPWQEMIAALAAESPQYERWRME